MDREGKDTRLSIVGGYARLGSPDEPRSVMVAGWMRHAPIGNGYDTALLLSSNDISSLRWERGGMDSSTVDP